jgi:hypothetical protein
MAYTQPHNTNLLAAVAKAGFANIAASKGHDEGLPLMLKTIKF